MFKYSHPTNGKFRQFVRKTDTVTSQKSRKLFGKDFNLGKNKGVVKQGPCTRRAKRYVGTFTGSL